MGGLCLANGPQSHLRIPAVDSLVIAAIVGEFLAEREGFEPSIQVLARITV